jgi:hypothetical protein
MRPGGTSHTWGERVEIAALAVVIVLGSLLLWVGVPFGGLWVAGQVAANALGAVLFALVAVPVAMVAVGWLLYRVNGRYEALRGAERRAASPPAWRSSLGEERAIERRRRGGRPLIEIAMTVSAVAAMLVLFVWFFLYAELPLTPLP